MKNCPLCNNRPLTFMAWCSGLNSLHCNCSHCGTTLKANSTTWIWISLIVIAMVAVVTLAFSIFHLTLKNNQTQFIFLVCIPVVIGSFFGYWFGGYRADAQLKTKEQFVELFITALREQFAQAECQMVDEISVKIAKVNGFEANIYLGNAYSAYVTGARSLASAIEEQVASFAHTVSTTPDDSSEQIFPVVRSTSFITATKAQLATAGYTGEDLPFYVEQITEDLFLLYALDSESGFRYLGPQELDKFADTPAQVKQQANEYLKAHFARINAQLMPVESNSDVKLYRFHADGNYESSVVFLAETIANVGEEIGDTPVIFLPARDMVLIAAKNDSNAIDMARSLAQRGYAELAYAISDQGYCLTEAGLVRHQSIT
jgi:uncharacterized protein YtpQ (UPF0354 family)